MSVRIYQISKETNLENKEIIALLHERGFEVKSASSSIDNISAEALIKEIKAKQGEATEPAAEAEAAPPKTEAKPAKITLPAGAIVKSAAQIEQEKSEKADQAKADAEANIAAARVAVAPVAPPTPATPATAGKAPGVPPVPAGKAPAPLPPRPAATTAGAPPPPAPVASSAAPTGNAPVPPPAVSKGKAPVAPPTSPGAPPLPVKAEATPEAEPESAIKEVDGVKILQLKPPIVVREYAGMLGIKPFRLISELMEMGIFASMNQTIEEDVATKVAKQHGIELEIRHRGEGQEAKQESANEPEPEIDESALLESRPPVVCVLGHVDHGKTTVLDTLRKANVVSGEAGGITQHVGAYQVEHNEHKITFLDTPGHAAFSKIRERGANVTDIAVLVIAADDGFKPQTEEALKFIQKANVGLVVAINKIDAKGANVDRVKQMMQERDIAPEDWGGEVLCAEISALKNENMDGLLELILLQAEVSELKANPQAPAEGVIVESQIEVGRGPTATVIIQRGTLKAGNAIVCGEHYCKVRAMLDEHGKPMKKAPPSTPACIMGWSGTPRAGSKFKVVKNEKAAKREAEEFAIQQRSDDNAEEAAAAPAANNLESLLAAIDSKQKKVLNVILKSDVHGSAEALEEVLKEIKSDKVGLNIVHSTVGQITKNDITMANTAEAKIVAFNVKQENGVLALAKHNDVHIIQHSIIYELISQVEEAMIELLEPEQRENKLGAAEIRQVFPVSKGVVAGCMITEGKVARDGFARLHRGNVIVAEAKVKTLKRFKDDAAEVRAGYECGIQLAGCSDYKEGDIIECFEIQEFRPSL